jgi:hypothetical protein
MAALFGIGLMEHRQARHFAADDLGILSAQRNQMEVNDLLYKMRSLENQVRIGLTPLRAKTAVLFVLASLLPPGISMLSDTAGIQQQLRAHRPLSGIKI